MVCMSGKKRLKRSTGEYERLEAFALIILRNVSKAHGVSIAALRGGVSSNRRDSHARFEAMYRMREELKMSYPQIGRIFDRHHSTVIHGVRFHKETIEKRRAQAYEALGARILGYMDGYQ